MYTYVIGRIESGGDWSATGGGGGGPPLPAWSRTGSITGSGVGGGWSRPGSMNGSASGMYSGRWSGAHHYDQVRQFIY